MQKRSYEPRHSPIRDACDLMTLRSIGQVPPIEDREWLNESFRRATESKYRTFLKKEFEPTDYNYK